MKINLLREAIKDIADSFKHRHLWIALGWQDIKSRYRRSTLGPIWLTISMSVTVGAMGPLYGTLFGYNPLEFIPHLALGMIFWTLISASISEFCDAFCGSSHFLKQMKLPLTVFVLRVCYRHLIILAHNIVIYPFIMLFLGITLNWNFFWIVPSFFLVMINLFWMGLFVSIFCTRYRDMFPMVASFMTLMFFVTPVIWKVEQLPESRRYLADMNPFTILVELLRLPVLGVMPSIHYWLYASIMAITGLLIAIILLARCQYRIAYWL